MLASESTHTQFHAHICFQVQCYDNAEVQRDFTDALGLLSKCCDYNLHF